MSPSRSAAQPAPTNLELLRRLEQLEAQLDRIERLLTGSSKR